MGSNQLRMAGKDKGIIINLLKRFLFSTEHLRMSDFEMFIIFMTEQNNFI